MWHFNALNYRFFVFANMLILVMVCFYSSSLFALYNPARRYLQRQHAKVKPFLISPFQQFIDVFSISGFKNSRSGYPLLSSIVSSGWYRRSWTWSKYVRPPYIWSLLLPSHFQVHDSEFTLLAVRNGSNLCDPVPGKNPTSPIQVDSTKLLSSNI